MKNNSPIFPLRDFFTAEDLQPFSFGNIPAKNEGAIWKWYGVREREIKGLIDYIESNRQSYSDITDIALELAYLLGFGRGMVCGVTGWENEFIKSELVHWFSFWGKQTSRPHRRRGPINLRVVK